MLQLAPPVKRRAAIAQLPEVTPAQGTRRGRIALMQGCVQRVFFGDVNGATVRVLSAEGWEVHAPRRPRCCGSLQLHAGVEEEALELAKQTIAAYEGFDAVAVNVAGCGSGMKDYAHLLADDPQWAERAAAFSARVRDVSELLAEHEPQARRHPLPLRVAYHDACHLAHAQGVRAQPRELLRAIPELELLEPADWEICCGSAGIYNLVQPAAAAELGARKAANLVATGADAVAAGNPGCALQIAAHLDGRELPDLPPDDPAGPFDPGDASMSIDVAPTREERLQEMLSGEALDFVGELHARLEPRRRELLTARRERAAELLRGGTLDFRPETREIREGDWRVAEPPRDFRDRRVEITGPTDRKLVINALNSGARGFMADFEDANSPTWANQVGGHVNLVDAIEGTIEYTSSEGKEYRLVADPATLLVRPRGLHLPEKHLRIDGDAGLRRAVRLRHAHVPRRAPAGGAGPRRLLLPAQARAPPRGALVGRRVHVRRGGARPRPRHAARDGADRDAAVGLPDGRDPLGAARPLARPQRRPLGLHLLDDQVLPRAARSSCCPTATT